MAGEDGFGEVGFEAGDAGVEEAVVLAGGLDPLGELLIVGDELAVLQAERPVLRVDSLDGVGGEVDFEVADAAQELADLVSLTADLGVRGLEGVLGVKRAVLPGPALSGVMAAAGGCGSWTIGDGFGEKASWLARSGRGRCGRPLPRRATMAVWAGMWSRRIWRSASRTRWSICSVLFRRAWMAALVRVASPLIRPSPPGR